MVDLKLGEPVGERAGETVGEEIGVRWQPDAFARERERRLERGAIVKLTTRCRFCDRRVHQALAIEVAHGVAHESCWERRLRERRPDLWLVDRRGGARRSKLGAELEDGAHAVLRELANACPVILALRERTLAFLAVATRQGFVPAFLCEIPDRHVGRRLRESTLLGLYRIRLSTLFDLQLRLAVDVAKGRPPCAG